MSINKKAFFTQELPAYLAQLSSETEPNFGLMTPQHMVEHLTWILKSSAKAPEATGETPNEKQLGFQKFIENGAVLKHRPSDKTKADLPALKYSSLEEAITHIPVAVERFYNRYEANKTGKVFAPFTGDMPIEMWETFHYMHVRFHLWQFGLLPAYP